VAGNFLTVSGPPRFSRMALVYGVNYAYGETKDYSTMDDAHDFRLSLFSCFPIRSPMVYVGHLQALVAILRLRKAVERKVRSKSPFRCNAPSAVYVPVSLHSYSRSVNHAEFWTCLKGSGICCWGGGGGMRPAGVFPHRHRYRPGDRANIILTLPYC
jgi:hypothetical protein